MVKGSLTNSLNGARSRLILLLSIAFFYNSLRAYFLPITHDEALTFLYHVSRSNWEILSFNPPFMANNHLLNTYLVKFFVSFLDASEFVVRLPALIGCGLYLIGAYKIIKLLVKEDVYIPAGILLTVNPFILDYLFLSRGYSLGLGLLMIGIYYVLLYVKHMDMEFPNKYINRAFQFIMLSCLANLVFLHMFCALLVVFFLYCVYVSFRRNMRFFERIWQVFSYMAYPMLLSILLASVYYYPVQKMRVYDALYWGGDDGFWLGTVKSLIESLLYAEILQDQFVIFCGYVVVLVFLLNGIFQIAKYKVNKEGFLYRALILVFLWFVIIVSIITVQHYTLGTKYVIGRLALYFVPVFLVFVIIQYSFYQSYGAKEIGTYISKLLAGIIVLHGIYCGFLFSKKWSNEFAIKEVMIYLKDLSLAEQWPVKSKSLGVVWNFEPNINFYRRIYGIKGLKHQKRDGLDHQYDYYLLDNREIFNKYNLEILKELKKSNLVLAVVKQQGEL